VLVEFDSREGFAQAVKERVAAAAPTAELQLSIVEAILAAEDEIRVSPAPSSDLNLRVGHWFLRTEDVPFLDSVSAAGAFAAAAAGGAALAPAAIVAAAAFAGILWRLWRRGGRLSDYQVAILAGLSSLGPMNLDELLGHVESQGLRVTPQHLRDALDDLADFELNNGVTTPLVRRLDDGRWRAMRT
jgi:hypothetical protein